MFCDKINKSYRTHTEQQALFACDQGGDFMIFESYSELDTLELGEKLALEAKTGSFFALIGDLGAGKTAFSKGFAKGLGIKETITSPTFSIVNIYEGEQVFYHFDIYRIQTTEELEEIGYFEYIYGEGVCLVEWADIVNGAIPENAVIIKFLEVNDNYRKIEVIYADTRD